MAKIIGTAGHIDHGKSSLIKALTGVDPDRLAEEQRRGMTIDLGFAFLNSEIAFIDVPGHEKFIKNMVAGVSTVDLALLVIAADDGVMPQTREHFDILKLLQINRGVVALTKIDLVDDEWATAVEEQVRDLIRDGFPVTTPIVRVSVVTGEGIDRLRRVLIDAAAKTPARLDRRFFWMPIDRAFTVKGHGTVVTGSILSGRVRVGDMLDLLPAKQTVRVHGLQNHGAALPEAGVGQRAALNLANVAKEGVKRGDVLASVDHAEPTDRLDVRLRLLSGAPRALKSRARVRLHIGTDEIMARVKLLDCDSLVPGESALAQMLLERPTAALKRQPFIIRFYSPQFTIGGGVVLDNVARPLRRTAAVEHLQRLEALDPQEQIIAALTERALRLADLVHETGIAEEELTAFLEPLLERQTVLQFEALYFHRQNFNRLKTTICTLLKDFHNKEPLRPGIKKANLMQHIQLAPLIVEAALTELEREAMIRRTNDLIRLAEFRINPAPPDRRLADEILTIFAKAPFVTPPVKILAEMTGRPAKEVQRVIHALMGMGEIVRLDEDIYLTDEAVQSAEQALSAFAEQKQEIGVGEFRELLGTTRKFAVPLLNFFDERGITERVGEIRRILVKKSRS